MADTKAIKYKYTANTPASEIVEVFRQKLSLDVCKEDDPESGYAAFAFYEKIAERGETAMDMAIAIPYQSWAYWDLLILGEETESKIRKVLISKITDPMIVLRLYIDLTFWTDEEDKLLEAKFKGKLPTPEKQLADGTLTRAKWQ